MILTEESGMRLLSWFSEHQRRMAWRDDPTPYHVWVSEIMLQQTRVDTVHAYYDRFMKAFPSVEALSAAPEEVLLKQWEGLGYYTRARNLQKAAKLITGEYGGRVPDRYEDLRRLPGVGSYTAGAILSIAYHLPYPVVDGNVLRVLSRVLASDRDVREEKTKQRFEEELGEYLRETGLDPGAFNQGLMEVGALVCVPNGKPKCASCPWSSLCEANKRGLTEVLPVVSRKPEKKTERKTVFLVYEKDRILVVKRNGKDVLNRLYGFPMKDGRSAPEDVLRAFPEGSCRISELPEKRHVFTHRIWEMKCFEIRTESFAGIEAAFGSLLGEEAFPPDSARFADRKTVGREIALPTAFRKWPLFTEEGTGELPAETVLQES